MSRVRWYHFFFVLALFNVVVIMISLNMHAASIRSAQVLIDSAFALDEQSKIVQFIQQRVVQLCSPVNELFEANRPDEYQTLQHRFEIACNNMSVALRRAISDSEIHSGQNVEDWRRELSALERDITALEARADRMFEAFAPLADAALTADARRLILDEAGPLLVQMDRLQADALSTLGRLAQRNAAMRLDMLQSHKAGLDDRFISERYIIAMVFVILAGILAFGRRMHQADKALSEERRRVEEERRERLAAIGELCSSVAHGIRNPLASIRSSAQLALQLGQMDSDSSERLRDILSEGQRLGDRVTGLLSMARSSRDGFEVVDPASIVRSAARELSPELSRRGIELAEDISDEPMSVEGDRRRLEQAIIELLSNAMEQSKTGDTIRVYCRPAGTDEMALIAVEDQGAGVPPAIRERVFDLFFTTKPTGTGIGLATVKRVARLHGGDAMVREGAFGGARFEVVIPVKRELRMKRRRAAAESVT